MVEMLAEADALPGAEIEPALTYRDGLNPFHVSIPAVAATTGIV